MKEVVIELRVEGVDEATQSIGELEQSIQGVTQAANSTKIKIAENVPDDIQDATNSVNNFEKKLVSTRDVMKASQASARLLSGTIQLASASFAAFGVKSEEVEKTLLRVQVASQVAGGVRDLARGIGGLTSVFGVARTAVASFTATLLANPYLAVGAAILALVVGIAAYISTTNDATQSEEELKKAIQETNEALQQQEKVLDSNRNKLERRYSAQEKLIQNEIDLLRARGATEAEIAKKEDELLDTRINNSATKIAEEKINLLTLLGLGQNYITSNDNLLQQLIKQQVQAKTAAILNQKDRDKAVFELTEKFNNQFNKIIDARAERDDAKVQKDILRLEREKKAREDANEAARKAQDKAGKNRQNANQNAEKAEKERERLRKETTAKIIKDLDEESKAIIENNNKQLDILKQNLIEGKITEETFAAEKVLLDKKSNDEIIKLRDNFQLTELQQFIVGTENEKEIRKKNAQEIIKLQRDNANIELGIIKENNQEKIEQTAQDEKNRIETFEREWLQKKIDLLGVEGLNEEQLASKIKQLEIDKNKARLETLQFGSSEYLKLKEQIAEQERDIDKKTTEEAIKNQKQIQDASIELATATISSLTTLSDIYFGNQLAKAKGNAKEEEKIARKQFQINKALQLGTAIINGVNSILAITSVPDFTLGVQTAIRIGAQVALNAASVAKILATKFQPGGGGGAATSAPTIPQLNTSGGVQPTSFQPATFGSGISQSQTFGGQQGSGGNVLRAYVSETDLTETQRRLRNIRSAGQL
jgi:cytochrome c biogenesis protein CcdA